MVVVAAGSVVFYCDHVCKCALGTNGNNNMQSKSCVMNMDSGAAEGAAEGASEGSMLFICRC